MKKYWFKSLFFLTLLGTMIACNKNEFSTSDNSVQRIPSPPADLTITLYSTDISDTTYICDSLLALPNVHCNGGDRNFIATATIQNIGARSIPPGILEVEWVDLFYNNSFTQVIPHNGIPILGIVNASRSYYMGPCDCADWSPTELSCFVHSFMARVDPNDLIIEISEGNNTSDVYDTCDGCGTCQIIIPPM